MPGKSRLQKRQEDYKKYYDHFAKPVKNDPYAEQKREIATAFLTLNAHLKGMSEPDEQGNDRKVSSNELSMLQLYYNNLLEKIDGLTNSINKENNDLKVKNNYQESGTNNFSKKELKKFEQNEKTAANYDKLAKSISKDYSAISENMFAEDLTLKDIFEKSRINSTYRLKEGTEIKDYSTNQNIRKKITIINGNGDERVGFFTEDYNITKTRDEDQHANFDALQKKWGKYAPKMTYDQMGQIFDSLIENKQIQIIEDYATNKTQFMKLSYDQFINSFTQAGIRQNTIRKYVDSPEKQLAFIEMFGNMCETMNRHSIKDTIGINKKSKINRRNTAFSSMADKLGLGGMVCKSQNIKINIDGKEVKGTFMDNSGAEDSRNVKMDDLLLETSFISIENLNLKKQIADLQILDYICGNPDRHDGNMHYITERDQDGNVIISGIKAIDNDADFGANKNYDGVGINVVTLDNIKVITKEMAEKIKNLDIKQIKKEFYKHGLNEKELDAMEDRLNKLKKRVEEDQKVYEKGYAKGTLVNGIIKVVDDDELNRLSVNNDLGKSGPRDIANNTFGELLRISSKNLANNSMPADYEKKLNISAFNMLTNNIKEFNEAADKLVKDDKMVYNSSPEYNAMMTNTKNILNSIAGFSGAVAVGNTNNPVMNQQLQAIKQQLIEGINSCVDYRDYKHTRNQREHKIDFDERPHKLTTAEKRWQDSIKTQELLEKQLEAFLKFEDSFQEYKDYAKQSGVLKTKAVQASNKGLKSQKYADIKKQKVRNEMDNYASRSLYFMKKDYDNYKKCLAKGENKRAMEFELAYSIKLGYALQGVDNKAKEEIRNGVKIITGKELKESNEELFEEACAKQLIASKLYKQKTREEEKILNNIKTGIDNPVKNLRESDEFKAYFAEQKKIYTVAPDNKQSDVARNCMHTVGVVDDIEFEVPKFQEYGRIELFGQKCKEVQNQKKLNNQNKKITL